MSRINRSVLCLLRVSAFLIASSRVLPAVRVWQKVFWRKTYYEPLLVKDDGSVYYSLIRQNDLPVTIETSFTLTPKAQFDQAGIMIRLDPEHWIKTGIEVVDEKPRLSCVVTNSFSDWSTQHWSEPQVKIRVHILHNFAWFHNCFDKLLFCTRVQ